MNHPASEEKWRLLFENMTTGFALHEVICDAQGLVVDYRFLEVNPAYEELTGLKASNLIGHTLLEVLPGTEKYWIEVFGRVALTGEPTLYENYSKELGRWYGVRAFCPKIGQFAVMVSDITERKLAQEGLEAALEFSNKLINAMQDGFSVLDRNGIAVDANPALCRMTGFSREELLGLNVPFPYWPPEEYESIYAAFEKTLRGVGADFELTFMRKSGQRFPVIVSPSVIRDNTGNIVNYIATVKDISEQKKALEALKNSEIWLRSIFDNTNTCIAATDNKGQVTHFNEAFRALLGYDAESLKRMNFADFTHPDDLALESTIFDEILAGKRDSYRMTKRYIGRDKQVIWVKLSTAVIRDAQGEVVNFVAVIQDITEQKAAEQEIEQLAFYDPLTRLPNRWLLQERLVQALASSARTGREGALLFIDLDNFKSLNDTLGHDIGDLLLQQVAQRLESCVRETDAVARLGGDARWPG